MITAMKFSLWRLAAFILVLLLPVFFLSACSKKTEVSSATDTLVLKNGGKIQCRILRETPEKVTVEYQGGMVDFSSAEIQTILRGQQLVKTQDGIETTADRGGEKTIRNYPYLRTADGKPHYGKTMRKEGGNFILEKEAGEAPEILPQDSVEKILLWPQADRKTLSKDFQTLIEKFPARTFDVDPYVVYSDVESSDFVLYRNAMEGAYHRFMVSFFELVDPSKSPEWGLGVILYGKYEDYLKSGGPPQTAGYYRPDDHVLRLYNMREMEMVKWVLGVSEKVEDAATKTMTKIEDFKGGAETGKWKAYDFMEKLQGAVEKDRLRIEHAARSQTMETIRHEGTHQVLNLFGIDRDYRGVWFSEGMADYLSPDEPNGIVFSRIMALKKELEEGHQLIPLDFLMSQPSGGHIYNFKDMRLTGQFYSQSWAFVHMLMNHYRVPFMAYLLELKAQDKKFDAAKDKALLQKHLGRKLFELDHELDVYVAELAGQMDEEEYLFFLHPKLRQEQQKKEFLDSVQNLRQ